MWHPLDIFVRSFVLIMFKKSPIQIISFNIEPWLEQTSPTSSTMTKKKAKGWRLATRTGKDGSLLTCHFSLLKYHSTHNVCVCASMSLFIWSKARQSVGCCLWWPRKHKKFGGPQPTVHAVVIQKRGEILISCLAAQKNVDKIENLLNYQQGLF